MSSSGLRFAAEVLPGHVRIHFPRREWNPQPPEVSWRSRRPTMNGHTSVVGSLLREWRGFRRMSQLDLGMAAEISPRHLSFVETGRAVPSREMVLTLARALEVPFRDRNSMLTAAG